MSFCDDTAWQASLLARREGDDAVADRILAGIVARRGEAPCVLCGALTPKVVSTARVIETGDHARRVLAAGARVCLGCAGDTRLLAEVAA